MSAVCHCPAQYSNAGLASILLLPQHSSSFFCHIAIQILSSISSTHSALHEGFPHTLLYRHPLRIFECLHSVHWLASSKAVFEQGSLDCEYGILPLSYRAPRSHRSPIHFFIPDASFQVCTSPLLIGHSTMSSSNSIDHIGRLFRDAEAKTHS